MKRWTSADYDAAFELWPANLQACALNTHVDPHWLDDGTDDFWWKKATLNGHRFMLVEAATGKAAPAIDHEAFAGALLGRLGKAVAPGRLPIELKKIDRASDIVFFTAGGGSWSARPDGSELRDIEDQPGVPFAPSPDGSRQLYHEGWDLYLRSVATDERRRLTFDGEPHYSYARLPDHDRLAVARSRGHVRLPPVGCFWSPDGQQVLSFRCDERQVPAYPFVESVPADGSIRPVVHAVRMPLAGDPHRPQFRYFLLATDGSGSINVDLSAECGACEPYLIEGGVCHWTRCGHFLYLLAATNDRKQVGMLAVDRRTGTARLAFQEKAATFFDFNSFDYHRPNVAFLDDDRHAIWYSQRDGWGHLYLVDVRRGEIVRQITAGERPVFDLLGVFPKANRVYFSASGEGLDENPYHRHLFSVDLLGSEPNAGLRQITDAGADHGIVGSPLHLFAVLTNTTDRGCLSPTGRYFVDNRSTIETPTETYLARTDTSWRSKISAADTSGLHKLRWRPPLQFRLHLPDSQEDVWGMIVVPRDHPEDRALPMVERVYAGPQAIAQPRSFDEVIRGNFIYGAHTLAEFGFAVIICDVPGTPYRSKQWHDAPYGSADRLNVGAHARVMHALGRQYPWLDDSRCGVSGHSWGGHAAAMAMLLESDTYSVGVSSGGIYDPDAFFLDSSEKALGSPRYSDGTHVRTKSGELAENYRLMSPSTYADRLEGKLLLALGDLDENAPPASLLRFTHALRQNCKSFDLLYLTGSNHGFFADPYFHKRTIDYFLAHLAGGKPLDHYMPKVSAGQRMLI